jgi:hypothetical protein
MPQHYLVRQQRACNSDLLLRSTCRSAFRETAVACVHGMLQAATACQTSSLAKLLSYVRGHWRKRLYHEVTVCVRAQARAEVSDASLMLLYVEHTMTRIRPCTLYKEHKPCAVQ